MIMKLKRRARKQFLVDNKWHDWKEFYNGAEVDNPVKDSSFKTELYRTARLNGSDCFTWDEIKAIKQNSKGVSYSDEEGEWESRPIEPISERILINTNPWQPTSVSRVSV